MSWKSPLLLFWFCTISAFGAPPPELPGVEVLEEDSPQTLHVETVGKTKKSNNTLENSWTAPPINLQLGLDATLIGMNRGALFVPRMTEGKMEPEVLVMRPQGYKGENHHETTGETGARILLEPGKYQVYLGSGNPQQRMDYTVEILEGKTTVLQPNWSGLVIQVLNKDGEFSNESYEISQIEDGESFGKGFGQPAERQKDLRTWILPPGLYRISRAGDDPLSLDNYITVQLNPGQLTSVDVVFNSETGELIAGGISPKKRKSGTSSVWTFRAMLGGSASLGATVADGKRQSDYWAMLADLRLSARYDYNRLYGFNEIRSRNSFQVLTEKDQSAMWNVTNDLISAQSNWIFRIAPWFGPYSQVSAKSHILKTEFVHPDDSTVVFLDEDSVVSKTYGPGERIRIQPAGFPLRFGEGAGGSLHWNWGTTLDVLAQSGFAWRQTLMNGVYVPINKDETLFMPGVNQYEWGQEDRLVIQARVGRFITFNLIGEIFLPRFHVSDYQFEEVSAELHLALTRHIEVSYIQELIDLNATGLEDAELGYRFEWQHSVQIRFFYNF